MIWVFWGHSGLEFRIYVLGIKHSGSELGFIVSSQGPEFGVVCTAGASPPLYFSIKVEAPVGFKGITCSEHLGYWIMFCVCSRGHSTVGRRHEVTPGSKVRLDKLIHCKNPKRSLNPEPPTLPKTSQSLNPKPKP